ncbi:hypothetical protein [Embleya sp. MST-111070]|uniref:hypothetical protein n=1 Tax=Embleya sp. MST-111070 TaxID=3398231 RepID=UPI003F735339
MIRLRPRSVTGLLTLTLLATTTACGGSAEKVARDTSPQTPGVTATTTPSTRTTPPESGAPSSTSELKRLLLAKTDMPEGWPSIIDTGHSKDEDAESVGCERLSALSNPSSGIYPVLGAASIVARDPAPGGKAYAILGSGLTSLSVDDAQRVLPAVRELLPRCPDERYEKDDMSSRVTARELARPRVGDDSMAMETVTRVDDTGRAWAHSVVLVRVDSTLIQITHVNLTGATPQAPDEALVRKQVDLVTAATRARRS